MRMHTNPWILLAIIASIASSSYADDLLVIHSVETIQPGRTAGPLAADRDENRMFRLYVPAGSPELFLRTDGGEGDCDVYLRHGQPPSRTQYDSRSHGRSTREDILLRNPEPGWWYVQLRAHRRYEGVYLRVNTSTFDRPGKDSDHRDISILSTRSREVNLSGRRGEYRYYRIDAPRFRESVEIVTSGGSGDIDLYLARGELPTPKRYEYRSAGSSTAERIRFTPSDGPWYLLVHAFSDFRDVDLQLNHGYREYDDSCQLLLLDPTDHDVWRIGERVRVRWKAGRAIYRVQVQYSLDGGRSFQRGRLPWSIDADDGELVFRLPNDRDLRTRRARVRVVNLADTQCVAVSRDFTITDSFADDDDDIRVDPFENNDSWTRATSLAVGESQIHRIVREEDEDWLRLGESPTGLALYFPAATIDLDVEVYTRSGSRTLRRVGETEISRGGGVVRIAHSGRYGTWVRIRAEDDDDTGQYAVTLRRTGIIDGPIRVPSLPRPGFRRPGVPQPHHRGSGVRVIHGNEEIRNIAGTGGSVRYYRIAVPEGTRVLSITTGRSDGDVDLYLQHGTRATKRSPHQSTNHGTTMERITLSNPKAGWYSLLVDARKRYRGVDLVVRVK